MGFKKVFPILAVLLFSVATACMKEPEPALDTTSVNAYFASVELIKKKLTPEQNEQFIEALKFIVTSDDSLEDPVKALADLADFGSGAHTMKTLNGKTFDGIIELARSKKVQWRKLKREKIEEVEAEIAEIEKKRAEYNESREVLSTLTLEGLRYYWELIPDANMSMPMIEMTLTNKSGSDISELTLQGVVTTPDRAEPWIDASYITKVPGGLKDGKTRHLKLLAPPGMEWGQVPEELRGREDTTLEMKILNARKSDGELLAYDFTLKDRQRMAQLNSERFGLEQELNKEMPF
ncbi:MAG: hypothetical protein V3W31_07185 [Thermodesulfobacteriota bacterium]